MLKEENSRLYAIFDSAGSSGISRGLLNFFLLVPRNRQIILDQMQKKTKT